MTLNKLQQVPVQTKANPLFSSHLSFPSSSFIIHIHINYNNHNRCTTPSSFLIHCASSLDRTFYNQRLRYTTLPSIMDSSPGSDGMDWEEDSSLHIIQPASTPWRKRSFDTYNDTNEPYRPNEAYSAHQVTDTLRHHAESVEPFIDFNGRPARFVTDFDGNVILQPIIQRKPPRPIGDYLPEWVKWIIYGAALLVFSTCELAGNAYIHTATLAVRVGDSTKRRLVKVTKKTFAPAPTPPRHRHDVPPHRRRSHIIRRVSPTSPGGRTHQG